MKPHPPTSFPPTCTIAEVKDSRASIMQLLPYRLASAYDCRQEPARSGTKPISSTFRLQTTRKARKVGPFDVMLASSPLAQRAAKSPCVLPSVHSPKAPRSQERGLTAWPTRRGHLPTTHKAAITQHDKTFPPRKIRGCWGCAPRHGGKGGFRPVSPALGWRSMLVQDPSGWTEAAIGPTSSLK